MLYVNEKYFNSNNLLWKDNFWQKELFEKFDIMSGNLGKTIEYLKIQKVYSLKNLKLFYLCKIIFLFVFLYPERYHRTLGGLLESNQALGDSEGT